MQDTTGKIKFIKNPLLLAGTVALWCILLSGCGKAGAQAENPDGSKTPDVSLPQEPVREQSLLEDGIYTVDFDTDGSMFHVNEACGGKGTLTVTDGEMVLHISMPSKNVINLFAGLAKDAEKDGAVLLQPTIDRITYSDGMTENVHGFDIPVTVIGEEFDLALLGKKGTWYDHKVSVSNPVPVNPVEDGGGVSDLADGEYLVDVTIEGGSGRATVLSPATVIVQDQMVFIRLEWSSPNYDYMKVGEQIYYPVNKEGNSVFEFPVRILDEKLDILADTVAMGTPHEIGYSLTFDLASLRQ